MKKYAGTWFLLITALVIQVFFSIFPAYSDLYTFAPSLGFAGWARLIPSLFSHAGWDHFIGNYTFGLPFMLFLETKIGRRRLIEYFLLCGVAGSLCNLFCIGPVPCLGSSGAIFGVMVGATMLFGESKLEHLLGMAFVVCLLMPQIIVAPLSALSGIAFYAHVGGGLMGMALSHRLYR